VNQIEGESPKPFTVFAEKDSKNKLNLVLVLNLMTTLILKIIWGKKKTCC
jgi:hypothetical protein